MELRGFKEFLENQKLSADKINNSLGIIEEFEAFLANNDHALETATYDDLHSFSSHLIENNKNSYDNYVGILRYGHFSKNKQLIIACMEILDGSEVIENFSKNLAVEFGQEVRDQVFGDLSVPPLGLHPTKKPRVTKQLVERFLSEIDRNECEKFLAKGLRNKYTEYYKPARKTYQETGNLDDFLAIKRRSFLEELETHRKENTLFYTQEVDDQVIDYVRKDPSIEAGVRNGDTITITKIPYMTKQFLNEADSKRKRYYYCHCPWVREAFKEESQPVPPVFCNCSGGFYKNYWEAVLGQPVEVEVLESVLNGGRVCRFALHLPSGIVETSSN